MAAAPTFCKCTCFTNSTIIEIKYQSSSISSGSHLKDPGGPDQEDADDADDKTSDPLTSTTTPAPSETPSSFNLEDAAADDPILDPIIPRSNGRATAAQTSASCTQCNRAFCLSQSLPICKGAAEKDVVAMCFQRDSRKDQIIVWGFILGTAGLLGYAGLRRVLEMQEGGGGGSAGLAAGLAGGLLGGGAAGGAGGGGGGGRREPSGGLSVGRGGLGSTGSDAGRGRYATVGGHSRESSGVL